MRALSKPCISERCYRAVTKHRTGDRCYIVSIALLIFVLWVMLRIHKPPVAVPYVDDELGYASAPEGLTAPRQRTKNISIIIVISANTPLGHYSIALNSLQCYALMHDYPLLIVKDEDYSDKCAYKDMMFRRHCVVVEVINTEWALFLDADVAVINPYRLIEEFIDDRFDVTLYDRFYNWEVAAGSYLIRNSAYAKQFLTDFAAYEKKLPNSFHGTDNGALHMLLLDYVFPNETLRKPLCYRIWQRSKSYADLFLFEACTRALMGIDPNHGRLRILRKGEGWMRDIWLTGSGWSNNDFLVHGIKNSQIISYPTNSIAEMWMQFKVLLGTQSKRDFVPPYTQLMNLDDCKAGNVTWYMEERTHISDKQKRIILTRYDKSVERQRWEIISGIGKYI